MTEKKSDCKSCDDLTARLDRLEKRLEIQEDSTKHWKKRWSRVDEQLRDATGKISLLTVENTKFRKVIEKKNARISNLEKALFAESSEASPVAELEPDSEIQEAPPKKPRGKQRGTKGFGRKIRTELPVEEVFHDIAAAEKCCAECGKLRERLPFTEDSEEVHYVWKLVRIKHKRVKYKRTCGCTSQKRVVTAPPPPKLIPKGMLSTELWAHILIEKFLLQRPISRICKSLSLRGFVVSDGAIANGLKHLTKLFAPLYIGIRHHVRSAKHWQMDETHWRVFTDLMGKLNHKWWLWVTETKDATFFKLDPSRSSAVPMKILAGIEAGILTCDRYSAYKRLQEQGILLSYCWAHVRRDFLEIQNGFPSLKQFANKYIGWIDLLFHNNKNRVALGTETELKNILELMNRDAKRLLKRKDTHAEAAAALSSLINHWDGLTLFLHHPSIPMDNNASERALRNPVVGRKNYYGSRSIWSGCLAEMLFSIFATLEKNKVNPYQFMLSYLTACARNQGRAPQDASSFLPWNSAQKVAA